MCKKALEWRRETQQKSICAVRPKGVRHLVSALGFFDAFTAGNGSAFVLRFALGFYRCKWVLDTNGLKFYNKYKTSKGAYSRWWNYCRQME